MTLDGAWQIAIDTGGTFTDCLARDPQGRLHRRKILSSAALRGRVVERLHPAVIRISAGWLASSPSLKGFTFRVLGDEGPENAVSRHDAGDDTLCLHDDSAGLVPGAMFEVSSGEPAPVLAARLATRTALGHALPRIEMRLGTTRGTNALLERSGADVALFINAGLGDLLMIGDQRRPDLFELNIRKPAPLHQYVREVRGRMNADGSVLTPLDVDHVRQAASDLVRQGVRCAAIALMHSYRNPEQESTLASILRDEGFHHVACSAELAPLIEILPRAETAVVEAYLAPLVKEYLDAVGHGAGGGTLHVMTSAGGLVRADRYRAKDSLLSGPAAGVAGAAAAGRASGHDRIIGFDMGGTSTDVARYDGDFEYCFEQAVGTARLMAPALAIETVAAGGGSICRLREGRLSVGPESARADPGPACYGNGGPLTLTDINLLMGRIMPSLFEVPIDPARAELALEELMQLVREETGELPDRDARLDGFLAIANERMADAIRQVSLRRGYDPADYTLVSFGGAGGQHACAIASMLGMSTVVMPADASLLSAVGLSGAVIERFSQRQVLKTLEAVGEDLKRLLDACAAEATREVIAEGVDAESVAVRRRMAFVRLLGQDATIEVEVSDPSTLVDDFAKRYGEMYGHRPEGRAIEVESIRVVASSVLRQRDEAGDVHGEQTESSIASDRVRARFDGEWRDVPAYRRDALRIGETISGPAVIFDQRSSYVIESGWSAARDHAGAIVARAGGGARLHDSGADRLVQMELFANRFSSIAMEMGQILQRTALSTNVKRRLDFSCAVLDAAGELVVNAPHIPVHLGALGMCVRSVAKSLETRPGDVLVTNHPAFGGSHLPDVTVITPVFDDGARLLGYVANRAHHAEIGGCRPGSMPPTARRLVEEGVVISPTHLVAQGESRFDALERRLLSDPFPSRAVADNLADLRAAVAANRRGADALRALASRYGTAEVSRQMEELANHAERVAEQAIRELGDGTYEALERLDDGSPIRVGMEVRDGSIRVDFTGSSPQHGGNLNATPAIVRSAILYVLRLIMGEAGESAGLNEGIMRRVDVTLPPGVLNPDFEVPLEAAPAVVGGNVETSQRLVDTLLKALGLAACSQGTMNNVLFGNDRFGYYETVCGGSGATAHRDGADAVHTHMTNTRITDPETLEHRYPVRLDRFAVRPGSGGAGRHRGGNGVVREITFLEPVSLSVLSQHRVERPYGARGGEGGARGRQGLVRASGENLELASIDQAEVAAGDRLVLETPGGGGFGAADHGEA